MQIGASNLVVDFLVACGLWVAMQLELELVLIQTQMAQKPMLRAEVYAHAMRASHICVD